MNKKLNELKKVNAENCVSIILNTHRTAPDSQKDVIALKNLIKEAEQQPVRPYQWLNSEDGSALRVAGTISGKLQ